MSRRTTHAAADTAYLQAKFVEEKVDEVLDAGQDSLVQVLPCYALEDDAERRRLQIVVEAEVALMSMHCGLKHQQPQDHQVVLQHKSTHGCTNDTFEYL